MSEMGRAPGGLTAFEMSLSPGSILDSVIGPHATILGHRVEGGEFVVAVAHGGEVEHIAVRHAISRKASALRESEPDFGYDSQHQLLDWVPEAKQAQARELEAHLLDVLYGRESEPGAPTGPYDPTSTTLTQRRQAKTRELGISQATMTRRLQDYRESGRLGLIPHASRLLNASGALDVNPEILAVARARVNSRRVDSRKTLDNEYALLVDELARRGLVSRHEGGAVPLARDALPFAKFKKMVRHLDRGRDPRTAKIRQQQANRPLVTHYRHRAFDFGDRIEMDSTPIDVFVRDANGPVRAHAVFAICTSTRYLWIRAVAGAPRGRDLALLLWDMAGGESGLVPHSPVGAMSVPGLPRTELSLNAWRGASKPPASLPGCIWLDHGAEEENQQLLGYCARLGISINWARTRQPTDKAYVESVISEFARAMQLLPGHKGNTVENRPKSDPEPILTIEMLQAAIQAWQHLHVQRRHTGLPHPHNPGHFLSPLEAVQISLTHGVPLRGVTDPVRTLAALLPTTRQTPQDDGVTFRRRRYTCPGYEDVITASLARDGRRREVTFYFDPNRLGRLYWPMPGQAEVRILMCPEEAGEALLPFNDLRGDWLHEVQGEKYPTPSQRAYDRADLHAAMTDAMAQIQPDCDNVVPIRGREASGSTPDRSQHRATGGWDLTDLMHLLDEDHDSGEDR